MVDLPPQQRAERLRTTRLSRGRQTAVIAAVMTLLAAGGAVVHATGGTRNAWLHLLYVPVLLAAWGFGPLGGVVAGVGAGLVVGPLMPLDVAQGVQQNTLSWLYRLGFFVLIGAVAGGLNQQLRIQLAATQRLRRWFKSLVEHAPDLLLVCDADGRLQYASPSLSMVLGHEPVAVRGAPFIDFVDVQDASLARRLIGLDHPILLQTELRLRHVDGSWRHVELVASRLPDATVAGGVVLNGRDVTQRRAMEAELHFRACHDPVTGLINRQRFTEVLRETLAEDAAERGRVAVLLIGLERLRAIGETIGPDASEQVVTALGRRLERLVRPGDVLARYESSEFAVLCRGVTGPLDARQAAERLLGACKEPFLLPSGEVHVRASAGAATAADTAGDPTQLLRDAYAALWEASRSTGPRIQLFETALRERAVSALHTENALHGALQRREFELHYQPVVNLRTGHLVGVEALLRWNHPELGLVSPADFIPLAEQSGVIVPIGRWALYEACAQLAVWRRELHAPHLQVAVNVSARQLDTADLADDVRDALRHADLPPDALTLELTETTLFEDTTDTLEALIVLHGFGVCLAVDDFGTGYSSLGYLKSLPVDVLKIDRIFVSHLHEEGRDDAIVSAIIGLARSLGLKTVAEGVERSEHAHRLVELGCDHAQGFHYAAPLPAARLTAALPGLLAAERVGAQPL